jgi:hypothetical protein
MTMHRWRSPAGIVVFDAADLTAESNFWAGFLRGVVVDHGGWHMVVVDGEVRVSVQLVPDHAAPAWPASPQRIYVDLWVNDVDGARDELMSLGATLLQPSSEESELADDVEVYADPAGHLFRVRWVGRASERTDQ